MATWSICSMTGRLVTLTACLGCRVNQLQPTCTHDPTAHQPSGPACSLCGQPTDNGGLRPEGRAYDNSALLWPLCLDCYVECDPELVQARLAEWAAKHDGGTR